MIVIVAVWPVDGIFTPFGSERVAENVSAFSTNASLTMGTDIDWIIEFPGLNDTIWFMLPKSPAVAVFATVLILY